MEIRPSWVRGRCGPQCKGLSKMAMKLLRPKKGMKLLRSKGVLQASERFPAHTRRLAHVCVFREKSDVVRRNAILINRVIREGLFLSRTCLVFLSIILIVFLSPSKAKNLPPGKTGWPVIGESIEYLAASWKGQPEKFIFERISNYTSYIFKTNLMLQPTVVFYGAPAHKFLFANENKLLQSWWSSSIDKIFPSSSQTSSKEEAIKMRKMLPNFFKPKALQKYIGIMDTIAQQHFAANWENKDMIVVVYPLTQRYTFWIAYPKEVDRFLERFKLLSEGLVSIPVDFPGTPFHRSIKASEYIRKEFLMRIIKQRKID
ncbi:hypothetical protein ACSBR2_036865 [Camellia fascicularis]